MINIPKSRFILLAGAAVLIFGAGTIFLRSPSVEESKAGQADLPDPAPSARALLAKAKRAEANNSFLEAKQLYRQILEQTPTGNTVKIAQAQLGEVNMKLIFSSVKTPDSTIYEVKSGDTLFKIARKFNTTVELLKRSNHLTSDLIRPAQRLKVTQAKFSVVIDKSQNTLALKNKEEVLKVYRCATGKEGVTPTGTFTIVSRLIDPPWYSSKGLIPPGDPRNVLGSRWLGFDLPQYGIHGTTDPESIGKPVTKGCVRLANTDVEELFALLPNKTTVLIIE